MQAAMPTCTIDKALHQSIRLSATSFGNLFNQAGSNRWDTTKNKDTWGRIPKWRGIPVLELPGKGLLGSHGCTVKGHVL